MRAIVCILISQLCLPIMSKAQSYFQNIYADSTWEGSTMSVSPDAYYLIQTGGTPTFDAKLMKVDLTGNLLWSKKINAIPQGMTSPMRIIYHNNALLLTVAYQNAGYRNALAKLDTSGNVLWSTQLTYGDINQNTRIIPLSSGYLLCGHRDFEQSGVFTFDITLTRVDDGGNLVWAKAYGNNVFDFTCAAASLTSNNELVIAGNYGLRMPPDYDPMIARFDTSGNIVWMKTFNDASGFFVEFTPTDMSATSDGNFAITGFTRNTNSNYDPQVLKVDGNGNLLWAKRLYQIGWQEYGNSIICDSQNNIVVAGNYFLNNDYGDFFSKFDLAGNNLGTVKISNTTQTQTIWFNDIYRIRGGDLYERSGYGYAYSTFFDINPNYVPQCLITGDYFGNLNCSTLGGTYPFTIANTTWTVTSLTPLPAAQTNISSAAAGVSAVAITESQSDICALVGIEETSPGETIKLFPNPATDEFTLLGNNLSGTITIKDMQGRNVFSDEFAETNAHHIHIATLSKGVYFVELSSSQSRVCTKLIKQ